MDCSFLLEYKGMSVYECSKRSGIPYSTLSDIIKGRTPIERVNAGTLHALAETLGMSMDDLFAQTHVPERTNFELFKSNACHRLKDLGDMGFIVDVLQSKVIRNMNHWGWYPESLYILAMLDYVSRENNIEICADYDDLRGMKLKDVIYPASVIALCASFKSDEPKVNALKNAIPEFLAFNIVESEVRNVV